jgi:uncharacterized membrane protein (GlpM family)
MPFIIKVIITVSIILFCSFIGKKMPLFAGLIATMPLTGALVLIWLYLDNNGDKNIMEGYTKGAIWGIIPSILFFVAAYFCFKRGLSLQLVIIIGFSVWILGAALHSYLLK